MDIKKIVNPNIEFYLINIYQFIYLKYLLY